MDWTSFLYSAVIAGTPLLFATMGEILTQKSGNLNLGVEGMMIIGAVFGFLAGSTTQNALVAIIAAMIAGAVSSMIYGVLTVSLKSNQAVTGLSLTIFGGGLSSIVGQKVVGQSTPESIKAFFAPIKIPGLYDIPVVGEIFFNHDILVYISYVLVVLVTLYMFKTKIGLNLKAVGENPGAADAASINVSLYKYVHIAFGGALAGLGGAYLSLVYVPSWTENITAGRGWIAVALVIFAAWNPIKAMFGAYLFGGLDILVYRLEDPIISPYFIQMLPYVITIVFLVAVSFKKSKKGRAPKSLSLPYYREER